jgi:hypothetical protein
MFLFGAVAGACGEFVLGEAELLSAVTNEGAEGRRHAMISCVAPLHVTVLAPSCRKVGGHASGTYGYAPNA